MMIITQWVRPGFSYKTAFGFNVKGNLTEYNKMLSWCTECFGDKQGRSNHPSDYRWNSSLSAWGTITMGGYFHFGNEDDAMAFKLRWL